MRLLLFAGATARVVRRSLRHATADPTDLRSCPEPRTMGGHLSGLLAFVRGSEVRTTVVAGVAARIPVGMTGAALPLLILDRGMGAAVAGGSIAVYGIALGLASPAWGRLLDRSRPARVVRVAGVVAAVAAGCVLFLAHSPASALLLSALLGAATMPFAALMRATWVTSLHTDRDRDSAAAFESFLAEAIHIGGRLLVGSLAIAMHVSAAFAVQAALGLAGSLALAAAPLMRRGALSDGAPTTGRLRPLRERGWHYAGFGLLSFSLGAFGLALVVATERVGGPPAAALVLALWGGGSLVGALVVADRVPGAPVSVLSGLVSAMAVAQLALLGAISLAATVIVALVAGLPIAAALTVAYRSLVLGVATDRTIEYLAWATTSIFVGNAVGAATYGLVASVTSSPASLLAPAAAMCAAACFMTAHRRGRLASLTP